MSRRQTLAPFILSFGLGALVACAGGGPSLSTIGEATTVCGGSATVQGIDVSVYETSVDWAKAKAAGISFAFIRASDGLQAPDTAFAAYWAGARAAGVTRGPYQYFRASEDPIAQADLLLTDVGTLEPDDLPPVIDVETLDGETPAKVAAGVQAWLDHVQAMTGREPIVYAGFYSWQDDTGGANMSRYPLWHAEYSSDPCPDIAAPWTAWSFWQYSSTGTVDGVEGEGTDLDVFNGSAGDLASFVQNGPPVCGTIAATDDAATVIDDGDPCFATGGPPSTLHSATDAGEGSDLIWTHATDDASEENFAQWDLNFATAGMYRVEVYTAAAYAQSKSAQYVVGAGSARMTVPIDQTAVDGWQTLGEFPFVAGGNQFVHLGDNTGESGSGIQLVFDAVRVTSLIPIDVGSDAGPIGGGNDAGTGQRENAGCGCASGRDAADAGGTAGTALLALLTCAALWRRRCASA